VLNAQNTFPSTGNVGIGTITPSTTLQVIGTSHFGSNNNFTQLNNSGNLTFTGSAMYKVANNKYVFQNVDIPNYGLFLNSTDRRYEFRDSSGTSAFSISADSGHGLFAGGLSVGSFNMPPNNGLYVSGKVGIGTSLPDVKLHITGGSSVQLNQGGTVVVGQTTDKNLAMDNNIIQARNNGNASTLSVNKFGGDINFDSGKLFIQNSTKRIGINTESPSSALNVDGGLHLFKLTDRGYLTIGSTNSNNIVMDDDHIQARSNGDNNTLYINQFGGDVSLGNLFTGSVGIGTTVPESKLQILGGIDATLSSGGYIMNGISTFENVVVDTKSIQARNNGAASVLNLNPFGGTVYTNNAMQVGSLFLTSSQVDFGIGRGPGLRGDVTNNAVKVVGNFRPDTDNLWSLGSSFKRFTEVWSVDGSINTSDARDKTNIKDLNYGLKEIMKLRSIRFNWKDKIDNGDKLGLIAQDLQKVLPEVVRDYDYKTDSTGKSEKIPSTRLGVMYADIIPVLISAIQQQQKEIEELKDVINRTSQLSRTNNQSNATPIIVNNLSLEQNIPNPFNQTTTINYHLPQNATNAFIRITDMNGKIIKTIPLVAKGNGQIVLQAGELTAGTYQYSFIINGKLIDTKKMVLTK